jgi:hypothetical protein
MKERDVRVIGPSQEQYSLPAIMAKKCSVFTTNLLIYPTVLGVRNDSVEPTVEPLVTSGCPALCNKE